MLITPEIARKMLEKNTSNIRAVGKHNISAIVNDINNDGWRINGETICFNKDGVLCNGQHRLIAIAKAGKPVISLVVFNIPEDDIYDVGKKRCVHEILRADGYSKTNLSISGAANVMLYGFNNGGTTSQGTTRTLDFIKENYKNLSRSYELTLCSNNSICRKSSVIASIFCILTMYDDSEEKIKDIVKIAATGMPIDGKLSTPGLALRLTLQDAGMRWDAEGRELAFDAMYQAYLDYSIGYNRKRKYTKSAKAIMLLENTRAITGVRKGSDDQTD